MPHHDLDVETLYQFLDCPSGRSIEAFNLCGDYGDSIYYPHLFPFLERFKSDKKIRLVTNGSYRDRKFWTELVARMTQDDVIVFSIDGLEDTNHLYRVNSDWASILVGLEVVAASHVPLLIDTNVFSFNYDRIDEIEKFAHSYGADFRAKKTARFERDDLVPPEQYIDRPALYNLEYSDPNRPIEVDPDCKKIGRNTVDAENYFWPCGFIRAPLTFYKSALWKNKARWSMKNNTLDELRSGVLAEWIQAIESEPSKCDIICKMKCKKGQSQLVLYEKESSSG
jgi:hypothetical protein